MLDEIVILGANSGIGKFIVSSLKRKGIFEIKKVVRKEAEASNGNIYWNYCSNLPDEIKNATVLINCARGSDFKHNVTFNQILINQISVQTKYINFSSNCVFAKPSNILLSFLFSGDAYIREKRTIDRMSLSRDNTFLIRPTIVLGESGWSEFLKTAEEATAIRMPFNSTKCAIDVVSTEEVSEFVTDLIVSDFSRSIPEVLKTQTVSVKDFIGREIDYLLSTNIFFEGRLKNLITIVLTSKLLPNFLVYIIQTMLMSKGKNDVCVAKSPGVMSIEGMTRLYLCGGQTR